MRDYVVEGMKTSDVVENTGHDAKGATGLEYQFLYFISQLLKMSEKQESVSYERYDDVAHSTDDSLVLFQLKHTIKGTVSKPVNLSLRDSDLWKTIAVWIDIVLKLLQVLREGKINRLQVNGIKRTTKYGYRLQSRI